MNQTKPTPALAAALAKLLAEHDAATVLATMADAADCVADGVCDTQTRAAESFTEAGDALRAVAKHIIAAERAVAPSVFTMAAGADLVADWAADPDC